MQVCSPKDGFVTEVYIREGQTVPVNAPLLQMDTEVEDKALERLRMMESVRAIRSSRYMGEELELTRKLANYAIKTAKVQVETTKVLDEKARARFSLGVELTEVLMAANSAYAEALIALDKANDQLKQLEFAVKRHKDIDEIARKLSADQEAYINRRKDRLLLKSVLDGRVKKIMIAKGSFAELGSALLELE